MHRKRAAKIVIVSAGLCAFLLLGSAAVIAISGLRDDVRKADVAVVLGNELKKDGQPSRRLKARLDKSVEVYQKGLAGVIIVSGGIGKSGYDEAATMGRYLRENKIPANAIIEDSKGVNTAATARNLAGIMERKGLRSAIVVTQFYHVPRCRLALGRAGISPVYGAHADYFELRDLYSTAREVPAYLSYLLRPMR